MDEPGNGPPAQQQRQLPFNNLFLISGLVHGQNKLWMYVFTSLFLIFGYVSFQMIIMYPLLERLQANGYDQSEIISNPNLIFNFEALKLDRNIVLLLELGMFVFAFMGFYGGVKRLHGKSLVSVVTGYERFRMKRFWFAYIIWGSLILITTVISYMIDPSQATVRFDPAGFAFSALIMIALMPIQTGLEEVFFRGYLVQGLALIFRNGIVPLFLSSLLFAFAHMSNPEVAEYGWTLMFTYYCCFALFMGMITLLDEGTELAWGIHFANNMVSGLLITSPHSVIKPYAILEAKKEDPSAEIVIWFVLAAITFTAMLLRYRWRNFKLIVR